VAGGEISEQKNGNNSALQPQYKKRDDFTRTQTGPRQSCSPWGYKPVALLKINKLGVLVLGGNLVRAPGVANSRRAFVS